MRDVSLKYLSEFSYAEMADFLSVPISTVKKRLHDARRKLRPWLDRHTGDARGRELFGELKPSTHGGLKERIMTFTEFLEKIARDDLADVEAALDDHPDFIKAEATAPRFSTLSANALAVAAVCGRIDVVRMLLARGALGALSRTAVSPIAYAAIEARQEVVRLLLDSGVEPDIFAAAALGDVETGRALLTAEPSLVFERTPDGRTPLHFARSIGVAELLLHHGSDITATDSYGQSPVQWIAATGRHKELCDYLRARSAHTDPADIFSACAFGDMATIRRYLDSDSNIVRARRAAGVGVPVSSVGFTPLHEAAVRGEQEIAKLLLEYGADVNALGGQHQITPLHAAAAGGHFETVKLLLDAGADPGLRDQGTSATAEEWAKFFGHLQISELLRTRIA